MRAAIVAIIVPALCMAAQAQEAKPCPSGHICPICTEQDGVRSCKVERPGQQPELPQAAAPLDISPPSHAALSPPPPPPRPVFRLGPFVIPLRQGVVAVIAPPTPLLSFFVTTRRGWRGRRGEIGTER
jgi:hypothetical protein